MTEVKDMKKQRQNLIPWGTRRRFLVRQARNYEEAERELKSQEDLLHETEEEKKSCKQPDVRLVPIRVVRCFCGYHRRGGIVNTGSCREVLSYLATAKL
jgi:hypothetical protein